jgi:transcriptional regulator with XRE-family HTH domain
MAKTLYTHFGLWLRDQLLERHLSTSDFAARAGIQLSTVYRWTAGQRSPSRGMVARVAEVLGVAPATVWDVIEREGAPGVVRPTSSTPAPASATIGPRISPEDRPFAMWLRAELVIHDLTTGALARRLAIDVAATRAWTRGLRTPASFQLPRIAEALGVPVETIRAMFTQ